MLSFKIPATPWESAWLEGHYELSWLSLGLVFTGQPVKSIFWSPPRRVALLQDVQDGLWPTAERG